MSTKRFVTMRRVKGGEWEAADHFEALEDAKAALEDSGSIIDTQAPHYKSFWQPGTIWLAPHGRPSWPFKRGIFEP